MKILFTGGGTGGHIVPIVALVREIQKSYGDLNPQFFYVGPRDVFSASLLAHEGITVRSVFAGKIRRYGGIKTILLNIFDVCIKIPLGVCIAFWRLLFLSPDIVVSKGGYGAIPVTLAAWALGIPQFLHESDSVPGKANLLAARFARKVFTSFPRTAGFPQEKVLLFGSPIRERLLTGSPEKAGELFHLKGEKPIVMIIGGSQGAQRINDMILAILGPLLDLFEIIHQTGDKDFPRVTAESQVAAAEEQLAYYHPLPFVRETDLRHAYAVSEIIVSRAGASSIFEIAALGKPSILIPLPEAAQDHQLRNAYAYASTGAAIVMEAPNLTPHFFLEKLKFLSSTPAEQEHMAEAARSFAKPDAGKLIADYLIEYLER
ncbi:MAG: UDP-N-acetylglucosamine--N-acetylmuramyl-(pentapeptide) pyrophosphoryl-undecaprenol N-acetylglucosamine transferase [Candidatus Yanofskybacteria bacterium]|nr:UDP-N-acetylglucosamine--N-acetylmuramyl-(pentapeptide) pyrophosphoryl-undecaprenol N-acetylglucosamine transferase [Candidatus Yanofskybacteria bacterium]